MTRILYRALLLLHPAGFRRRFAGEMLCVFDEAAAESAASGFCCSIAWSLARHWFRQPWLWRTVGGIVGGGLTLLPRAAAPHLRFPATARVSSEVLIVFTVGVLAAILATLVVTVVLFQTLRRRRESAQRQKHGSLWGRLPTCGGLKTRPFAPINNRRAGYHPAPQPQ